MDVSNNSAPPSTNPVQTSMSEVSPVPLSPRNISYKKKTWLRILLILLATSFLVSGAIVYGKYFSQRTPVQTVAPQVTPTPTPTQAFSPTPTPDPTADWKIYKNDKFSFELKYPPNLKTEIPKLAPGVFIISILDKEEWIEIGTTTTIPYDLNKEISADLQKLGSPKKIVLLEKPAVEFRPATPPKPPGLPGVPYKGTIIYLENHKSKIEIEYFGSGDNENLYDQILATFKFVSSTPSASVTPLASPTKITPTQ